MCRPSFFVVTSLSTVADGQGKPGAPGTRHCMAVQGFAKLASEIPARVPRPGQASWGTTVPETKVPHWAPIALATHLQGVGLARCSRGTRAAGWSWRVRPGLALAAT